MTLVEPDINKINKTAKIKMLNGTVCDVQKVLIEHP